MKLLKQKTNQRSNIRIGTRKSDTDGVVRHIKINGKVEVAPRDGWLCFWVAGREVQIGPITPDQAERLAEDLGYEALD